MKYHNEYEHTEKNEKGQEVRTCPYCHNTGYTDEGETCFHYECKKHYEGLCQ